MSVQNLEQLRSGYALKAAESALFAGKGGGEAVKKIPNEIRTNGLLGSAAFALDKDEGRKAIYEKAILPYLQCRDEKVPQTLMAFIDYVSGNDAMTLRVLTSEALAYLNYFRRFAKKAH